ncbi:hypothetical protein [Clostridium sp.]|uniref:hypothetical protein n=1 Tax=Clostridium sp. TaxID=1506 RepID=UPI003F4C6DEC
MVGSNVAFASTTTEQFPKINVEQNQNSKKVDKNILIQKNYTKENGIKIKDLTYKNHSRKIIVESEFKTDIVEYNPIDNTVTLNNVKQDVIVSAPLMESKSNTTNMISSTSANLMWTYLRTRNYTFSLQNKTVAVGAALLAAALSMSFSSADSMIRKFMVATGVGIAAIIATSPFYGTMTVSSSEYRADDGIRFWHRIIAHYYWNGQQFGDTDHITKDLPYNI